MIVRISTERKRVKWLCGLISEFFDGFTVYKTTGYWQGVREKSIVFEIDTLGFSSTQTLLLDANIKMICRKICGYNRQDAVLVQRIESETVLL
jgi:hypothetical protein